MLLTCLRSRLGRRPFQLRREGGGVGRQSCQRPYTPTQGNMQAARLQTALKDTLCTVVVHDFHKVLGGESETQSSYWKSHRCVSGSSDVCTRRYLEQNALATSSSFVWVSPWVAGTVARSHYLLHFTLVCSGPSTIWREDVTRVLANGGKSQMMNTVQKKCPLEKSSLAVQHCGHVI